MRNRRNHIGLLQKCGMLLLVMYPILYTYVSSFNLNYGEISLGIIVVLTIISLGLKRFYIAPKYYMIFWLYAGFALIKTCSQFKITYLVPGGIAFSLFSLSLITLSRLFSFHYFHKFYKLFFLLTVIIYLSQLLELLPIQYRTVAIFPISDHVAYTDTDFDGLMTLREKTTRPSSLFLEPAYYAQFILIFLAIELFRKTQERKIFTPFSILAIFLLLVLKSGLGLVGLAVLLTIKLFLYIKKSKKALLTMVLILPITVFLVLSFLSSEVGMQMMERKEELTTEGSSGFVRLVQGFLIFDALPLTNKILGINMEDVAALDLSFFKYTETGEVYLFTNGFCTLLLRTGLVGLALLLYIYIRLFRNGTMLCKSILILLLVMSLIEQVYLTSSMLLCTIVANTQQIKQIKQIKQKK